MQPRKRTRLRHMFWTHLRQVGGRLVLAGLCTLGVAAADLLKPWPLKIILDHGILDRSLPEYLRFLPSLFEGDKVMLVVVVSCAIVLIALLGGLLSYSQIFITSSVGYKMVYSLRRELFAHLQRLSLSFHNQAKSGDLLTRIAVDTNTLKNVFAESILKFSTHVLEVIGMFAIMFFLNWKVSLIAFAMMPFLCFSLWHLYRKTKASVKKQRRQEGKVASRMNEVLTAIPLVQAFAREKYEEQKFDAVTEKTLQESIRIARLEAAATRSSQIITAVGTAAAVCFGALQVLKQQMSPGDLVAVVLYLTNLYKPLRGMAKLSTDFSKALASADRISEILDLEPEIQDRPDAIEAPRLKGGIVFRNVSFDYGDGKDVLKNIGFAVSPGQRLALVGVSGAGKSTIVSLILRLYEAQGGAILIDGTDIRHYRRESLRRQIGIVLQNPILFGTTIRENIAYGKPEASLEEIVAAADAANADEFIRELEDGYDTVIGERGATLSGGQRQRIAIARAVIRDAPILILDEPMTGLDVESEAKVREALDRLMACRTCVMITDDLPSIAHADMVLLLEAGQIVERGTHTDLMANSGRYRQLYELNLQPPALDPAADRGGGIGMSEPETLRINGLLSAVCRGAFPANPDSPQLKTASDRPSMTEVFRRHSCEAASGPTTMRKKELPLAVRSEAFPADPDFPQLKIASDPRLMLEIFRRHLKPVSGKTYHIQDCIPIRFRCRQSTSRCVLQYNLRVVEPVTDRQWNQSVTGLFYAQDGEAERLWQQMQTANPRQEIPERWLTFEPVGFIPELQMLVQVFPYDRKLRNLSSVMNGALCGLDSLLLARLGPGRWHAEDRNVEPTRYRTELGAALRYTLRAREAPTSRMKTVRCYLKVYRNQRGEETFHLLRSLSEQPAEHKPYSIVRPIAYLSELRTLVLEEAAGTALQQLLLEGRDPEAAVRAAARAVAAFNQSDLAITRRHSLAEQFDDVKRESSLVQWACPRARTDVVEITAAVLAGLEEAPPAPIHRDLKTDHIFLSGERVIFIDLDSVVLGDPVRDPAHLFAHIVARVGLDSMPSERSRTLAVAFAEEYFRQVPKPWRKRFPLQCAGALVEVAGGIFKRQEPNWPEKVTATIDEAKHALSGGFR